MALTGEGSEAASEEIVRRYRPALVRYAGSIVGRDRAEDVVQDSLAKAIPAIGGGIEELHLRPWLYTIVRNTALNALRDAAPAHEQLDENYDGVEQPPQALERRESVRSLVAGIRELPDAQREALVKREMEGRSHEEIAAELGISAGAARQLIFRARDALRAGVGSLVPMPLLRYLFEGGGDGGVVAAGAATGGGALAAKAAIALVATGALVGGGLAVRHADHPAQSAAPPVASGNVEADLATPPAAGSQTAAEDRGGGDGSGGSGRGSGHVRDQPHRGRGPGRDDVSGSDGAGGGDKGQSPGSGSGSGDRDSGSGGHGSGSGGGGGSNGSGRDGSQGGGGDHGGGSVGDDGKSGSSASGGDSGSGSSGGDSGHSGSSDGQPAEAIEADSGSTTGEQAPSGSDSSGGSGGSGSGSPGGSGGGSESNSEISRDPGGGDGFQK